MFAAAAPAMAAAAGGVLSYLGQRETNQANRAMSREQMDFQERMRNTSWQAAKADMVKAGINPMLAVSQGGAAVPGGAMSTSQNPMTGVSAGISSALQATLLKANLDKIQSDTDLNKAQQAAALSQANLNSHTAQKAAVDTENARNIGKGLAVEGDIDSGVFGRFLRYADRGLSTLNSASSVFSPLASAYRMLKGTADFTHTMKGSIYNRRTGEVK